MKTEKEKILCIWMFCTELHYKQGGDQGPAALLITLLIMRVVLAGKYQKTNHSWPIFIFCLALINCISKILWWVLVLCM